MSKRKYLVWSLIGMMVMSSLTGCSTAKKADPAPAKEEQKVDKEEEKEEKEEVQDEEEAQEKEEKIDLKGRTITFGAWYDIAPDESTGKGEKLAERKKELEEKYNCKIEFLNTNNINDNTELLVTSTLAGDPIADVLYIDGRVFHSVVAKDVIQPLDTIKNLEIDNPMWDGLVKKSSTYKGHIYAVDNKTEVRYGVYYNKRMFEEAGLPDLYELQRNGEWTWDKMKEFAEKLTIDKDGDGVIDQYGIIDTQDDLIAQLIYSNNGEPVTYNEETNEAAVTLNSEACMEALKFYTNLVNEMDVAFKKEEGMSWDFQMQTFGAQKVAILPHAQYASQAFKDMEDDYGWVMFPKGPKADSYKALMGTINMQVIPAGIENVEEVALIMKEWNEPTEEGEDGWKEEFYPVFRDANAVDETMEMQRKTENRIFPSYHKFPGVDDLLYEKLYIPLSNGEVTPAAGVEAITPQLEAIINDNLKN